MILKIMVIMMTEYTNPLSHPTKYQLPIGSESTLILMQRWRQKKGGIRFLMGQDNKQIEQKTFHHVNTEMVFLWPIFPSLDCGSTTTVVAKDGGKIDQINDICDVPQRGGGSDAKLTTDEVRI